MTHSIISWDSSYRNFFHLINALAIQSYPKDDFELIYVEQRTKQHADEHNHKFGLKSLSDKYNEFKNKFNIKIIYLNDPPDIPYHNGKCINAGLEEAKGEIISVMDGDQLLEPDFLINLTEYHKNHPKAVVNLFRKSARYPVKVNSWKDWMKGEFDFNKCLGATITKYTPIPKKVGNKGPMVSVKRKYWEMIRGCDPHILWSTVLSKFGGDITTRLEIATGTETVALPNTFSVHPWHPIGTGTLRFTKEGKLFGELEEALIKWSIDNKEPDYKKRTPFAEKLYLKNKKFVDTVIYKKEKEKLEKILPQNNLLFYKLKIKFSQQIRRVFYKLKKVYEIS